jgi:hypothetical protein
MTRRRVTVAGDDLLGRGIQAAQSVGKTVGGRTRLLILGGDDRDEVNRPKATMTLVPMRAAHAAGAAVVEVDERLVEDRTRGRDEQQRDGDQERTRAVIAHSAFGGSHGENGKGEDGPEHSRGNALHIAVTGALDDGDEQERRNGQRHDSAPAREEATTSGSVPIR